MNVEKLEIDYGKRIPKDLAEKFAIDYNLYQDSRVIFLKLMAGESVSVKAAPIGVDGEALIVTPVYKYGLYFYEVTRPPEQRPRISQAFSVRQVAKWAYRLSLTPWPKNWHK